MKIFLLPFLAAASLLAQGQIVRVNTSAGNIDIELLQNDAPGTVQNFLRYVNRGAYNNSFFHRLVPGFVLQGGGFRVQNGNVGEIPADPPIRNEYKVGNSNVRGTVAMAKLGSGPDTATNQWFFNLADNSANLNNQNGGFTVFGRVTNAEGLAVMDKMAATPTFNLGEPFDAWPLTGFTSGNPQESHMLLIKEITLLNRPALAAGGIITASAFGGFASAAPGSFIEIYGNSLSAVTRGWTDTDFRFGRAPTSLEGVSVTIGGIPGYVNYVSENQINAQVPTGVFPGNANVIVSLRGQTVTTTFRIRERAPGLLAPAAFKTGDKQFVACIRPDGTLINNGSIAGLAAAPARPGETLIFFGTGFGPVTPPSISIAGQVVSGTTALTSKAEFKFGDAVADITFAGLAPALVGVYQFNVVLPATVADGDVPLAVTLDGTALEQTLFLPVRR